jgi:four helix bundle suffix protein
MESYKKLTSFILATIIYDLTVKFCRRWIDKHSRTKDQMEQAARSIKQNIAEGYTMQSLEGYIKLLGVAEGSAKELAADYEDFLRQRGLEIWSKNHPKVKVFRAFRATWLKPNIPNTPNLPKNPQEAANMLLSFCQMESYLLKKQIDALKEKFVREGGFRENLFRQRLEFRKSKRLGVLGRLGRLGGRND